MRHTPIAIPFDQQQSIWVIERARRSAPLCPFSPAQPISARSLPLSQSHSACTVAARTSGLRQPRLKARQLGCPRSPL